MAQNYTELNKNEQNNYSQSKKYLYKIYLKYMQGIMNHLFLSLSLL